MIRQMIIDAGSAAALSLLRIGQVAAIAVLVVRPEQCHVVGYFQSMMIGIERLLVGAQHLWYFLHRLVDIAPQHVALVVDGLLHQGDALRCRVSSFHRIVVYATQAKGVCVLIFPIGLDTFFPIVLHRLAVGDIVEVA